METRTISILLIEDNPGDARLIQEFLKEPYIVNFKLSIKHTLSEGLEESINARFDIILLDLSLPDSSGLNTVSIIQEKIKSIPIIILTGRDDKEFALEALKLGIEDYLVKSKIDSVLLERSIFHAIEGYRFHKAFKLSEKKYREELNRINFYKDLFIHDISDIFQGIVSATQLYNIQLKNPKMSNYIVDINEIIENQIIRGAKLISKIIKLFQLEETKGDLKPVLLNTFILRSIKTLLNIFPNQIINIQIKSVCSNYWVQANDFLEELFDNILVNAVRHNENSTIEIIIKISKERIKLKSYVKVQFMDNGIGIQDTRKDSIFLRGTECDTFKCGLGLSLVSRIIERYGGKNLG